MKKLLFILAMVLNCTLAVSSQTAQVATLSHDGAITTFYSANALKDAYAAAAEGDVITLSAGTFAAPTKIEKNITVRGAGMMLDAKSTILNGDVTILTPDSETANFTLEGVYQNGTTIFSGSKNAKVIKCQLKDLEIRSIDSPNKNLTVINCKLSRCYSAGNQNSLTFINTIIRDCSVSDCGSGAIDHCVLIGRAIFNLSNAFLTDCIIIKEPSSNYGYRWGRSMSIANCACYGMSIRAFEYSQDSACAVNESDTDGYEIFENQTTYELKDEYADWVGGDGTQLGVHGGSLPFDPTPTNPQITKFNVSSKTTADGMLSVDIEVKANN